jgi:hypothetical protein
MTKARTLANLANGTGLTLIQQEVITTAVSAVDFDLPAEYSRYKLFLDDMSFSNTTYQARLRVSTDGGSTFDTTADYKSYSFAPASYGSGSNNTTNTGGLNGMILTPFASSIANDDINAHYDMIVNDTALSLGGFVNYDISGTYAHHRKNTAARVDAIRVYSLIDNFTAGTISLYAYKETI